MHVIPKAKHYLNYGSNIHAAIKSTPLFTVSNPAVGFHDFSKATVTSTSRLFMTNMQFKDFSQPENQNFNFMTFVN